MEFHYSQPGTLYGYLRLMGKVKRHPVSAVDLDERLESLSCHRLMQEHPRRLGCAEHPRMIQHKSRLGVCSTLLREATGAAAVRSAYYAERLARPVPHVWTVHF